MTNGDGGQVLAAPDKFKGSLTARQAAARLEAGLRTARPGLDVRQLPVADGGDGTVDAALAAGYLPVQREVRGPAGDPVPATYGWRDGTAVIEAAQACGLSLLPGGRLAPLTATSYGAGQLIADALARGARRIILGLGGVATTDGGAGLVQALGGRLLDAAGGELPGGGAALAGLDRLDLSGLRPLAGTEILVASDVDNPLLGGHGAAAVYGPQKGASPAQVPVLDAALSRWADLTERTLPRPAPMDGPGGATRYRDRPGAGAAGGLGFAALAFLGARLRPGIELMLDMTGFAAHLPGARLVITGEGSLDEQSLHGKAPVGVAQAAAASGVPVVAVAGRSSLDASQLYAAGLAAAYPLTSLEPDPARCMAQAGPLLERLATQIAADWLA